MANKDLQQVSSKMSVIINHLYNPSDKTYIVKSGNGILVRNIYLEQTTDIESRCYESFSRKNRHIMSNGVFHLDADGKIVKAFSYSPLPTGEGIKDLSDDIDKIKKEIFECDSSVVCSAFMNICPPQGEVTFTFGHIKLSVVGKKRITVRYGQGKCFDLFGHFCFDHVKRQILMYDDRWDLLSLYNIGDDDLVETFSSFTTPVQHHCKEHFLLSIKDMSLRCCNSSECWYIQGL